MEYDFFATFGYIMMVLSPYILVPLFVALFLRKFRNIKKGWSYLITSILILCYVFYVSGIYSPSPDDHPRPAMQSVVFYGGIFLLLISLILQFIFNKIFIKKKTA